MDQREDAAGLDRSGREALWRALMITSGSAEHAHEAINAARAALLASPTPVGRVELWREAFDHLDRVGHSEFELLVGEAADGPIRTLSDRLASLPAQDARALIAHHIGGFEAGEVVMFARPSGDGTLEPDARRRPRPAADGEGDEAVSLIGSAELALNRLSDEPVGLQFARAAASLAPNVPNAAVRPTSKSRVPLLTLGAVTAGCLVAVVALAVADGGSDEPPPRPTPEAASPLAMLPAPSPCRVTSIRDGVSVNPSELKSATDRSLDDVLESTDGVVRGRLGAVSARDGWVTFRVEGGRVVDGDLEDSSVGFSIPGRLPSPVAQDSDLEFLAFVARDAAAPVGWSAPVRGGVWVACGGGRATSLGDSTPLDDDWLPDPTLAAIEDAVQNRREHRQTMALTAIDAETMAGGIRLRDGTGLSVRLPRSIDAVELDVAMIDERVTSLSAPGFRVTLSVEPCSTADGGDTAEQAPAMTRSTPACVPVAETDLDVGRPLTADERSAVEGFAFDRSEPREGTLVHVAPDGHLVAIDASTLLPRWRSLGGPAAPVGIAEGVVVAAIADDLVGFDADAGRRIWSISGAGSTRVVRTESSWLLGASDGNGPSLRAIDPATGEASWRLDGPAGVEWSSPTTTDEVVVFAEWSTGTAHRLVGVDLVSGRVRWSVALGNAGTGTPRFALDADRSIAVAFDGEERLVRIDAETGRVVWRTTTLRGLTIDGIWPNSVTLRSSDRRITVGLTDGFLLPP